MLLIQIDALGQAVATIEKITPLPASLAPVSAIEHFNKTLMVIGNNATHILLLNNEHKILDSLSLFDYLDAAEMQDLKSSMQATAIIRVESQPLLLIMGSGKPSKDKSDIWLLPLNSKNYSKIYQPTYAIPDFYTRLKRAGIASINIDGSAQLGNRILLANAGTGKKPNQLINTEFDFWNKGISADFKIIDLTMPHDNLMISGLEYDNANDMLIFSATPKDNKNNTVASIGYIFEASKKMQQKEIKPDGFLSLAQLNNQLTLHSMQSVCVEQEDTKGTTRLHICVNDQSGLGFVAKIGITWIQPN
jgi:hypothetical protein